MFMMGNKVQSFSHEVGSGIVRWYIRKGKGLAYDMFSCEMASNVDVLGSRIVVRFSATLMPEVFSAIIVIRIV